MMQFATRPKAAASASPAAVLISWTFIVPRWPLWARKNLSGASTSRFSTTGTCAQMKAGVADRMLNSPLLHIANSSFRSKL
jgi:hypothetical protein